MARLVQWAANQYHEVITKHVDPRSQDWLLNRSILVPVTIIAIYVLTVTRWGPRFMKHREPLNIKPLIVAYNISNIAACSYIFYHGCALWWKLNYSFLCQPVDMQDTEDNRELAELVHFYAALKIWDLLDTIFFVLRKKNKHVSFLHVYHHAGMVFVTYLGCNFSLNGGFNLMGIINCFVHIVMYSYYLYTLLFPRQRPGLGVKKSLTLLQLAQFSILLVHNILPFLQRSCEVQRFWAFLLVVQYTFMIVLFSDFYIKSYSSSKKAK